MTDDDEIDFELKEWTARFMELVKRDGHALTSWQSLTNAGVDSDQLSGLVPYACDFDGSPGSKLIEQVRAYALQEAKSASKLANRLEADCTDLQKIRSELPDGLLEKLSETIIKLRSSAKEVQWTFSKHKLNPNFFLALMIAQIQEKTGSPRYREISLLLECAHVAFGQSFRLISEESVRKTYSRFMKDNPFRNLVGPEGRGNFILGLIVVFILHIVTSGDFSGLPKSDESTDESRTGESLSGKSLEDSIAEIFKGQKNANDN